jgi:iron complex transport system substrate-binding protein
MLLSRKYLSLFLAIMVSIALLAGCKPNTVTNTGQSEDIHVVKHELGETKVKGTPQRIVVLEYGFIEAVLASGLKPVGVADDNKPTQLDEEVRKQIEGYTSVGTRSQPSLEVIKMLKPDLIIGDLSRHKNIYEELSKIAPTIILKNVDASYEETIDSFKTIGEAVGNKDAVEKVIETHKTKLNGLKAKIGNDKSSVLLVLYKDNIFNARTSQFFTPGLLEAAGFNYALKAKDNEWNNKMTIEQLSQIDPDKLIMLKDVNGGTTLPTDDPIWKSLKAVKNNQVYEVNINSWSLRRSIQGADKIIDEAEKLILK